MVDETAKKKRTLRQVCLVMLGAGAISTLMPAAFADYAECLGGARQTDTLRNPLVPGAPHGVPGQQVAAAPPPIGSGCIAPGVVPGDVGNTRVTSGYADPTHGSIFPAGGSQGPKGLAPYAPGAGRYPTKNGGQQGMYDWGQGARYGKNTQEWGGENNGQTTYEGGYEQYGQRRYDMGQGMLGQTTYQGNNGMFWGQQRYESGGKLNGIPTYDPGMGNYGQRSFDYGQGLAGQGTYQGAYGNYGQKTYEYGAESSGQGTYAGTAGNGGQRRMDNGGGGYGDRTYEYGQGNGGTQLYSGKTIGGGQQTFDNGQGNGGKKLGDGGAGNGGSKTNDFGSEASGNKIENEGGARQGGRGTTNNGGPRSDADRKNDNVFSHQPQSNNYDFQGPLPTVRTFCRYLVILGVVVATIWMSMAAVSVVMGNRNGPERVIGAVGGLLLLLAGYTIWKIVQMNTFHANTTGFWSNTRGMAQQRQQNGPVNPPTTFAPPEDPGQTQAAPMPGGNQMDQRMRGGPNNYRPVNPKTPNMSQGPYNYRPQGMYEGHPHGPDRVGSYDIPAQGFVPEPPPSPVINPNR